MPRMLSAYMEYFAVWPWVSGYNFFFTHGILETNPFYHMNYFSETTGNLLNEDQNIVEIKLWGLYLLTNPGNLYNQVIESSLDRGPVEKNPQTPGRITFRFSVREWEGKIKRLLYANRIPVIVKSSLTYNSKSFITSPRMVA